MKQKRKQTHNLYNSNKRHRIITDITLSKQRKAGGDWIIGVHRTARARNRESFGYSRTIDTKKLR